MIRFLELIAALLGLVPNIKANVEIAEDLKVKPKKLKRIIVFVILIFLAILISCTIFHNIDNSVVNGKIYSSHDWRKMKSQADNVALGTRHYVNIGKNDEAIYCHDIKNNGQISLKVGCNTENRDAFEDKHLYEDGWRVLLLDAKQEIIADLYISDDVPIPTGVLSIDAGNYYILFQLIDESVRYDDTIWFEVKYSKSS